MAARTGQGNTPPRSIRVPPDLWVSAQAEAKRRGESVTAAIVAFLRRYASGARE